MLGCEVGGGGEGGQADLDDEGGGAAGDVGAGGVVEAEVAVDGEGEVGF